jgi:hypothetical protein
VIYTDGTPTVASGDALPPSVARIAAARQRGEVRATPRGRLDAHSARSVAALDVVKEAS